SPMRWKICVAVVAVVCVAALSAVLSVSGGAVHADEPKANKVEALRKVVADLALDKKTYEVGEPIVLRLRLTNSGLLPLEVPGSSEVTGRRDGYSFQVKNDKGELLKDPLHEYIALIHSIGTSESVQTGKSCTRDLLLNYRVPPLEPGKYTVKG